MGYLVCPLCEREQLSDVQDLQKKVARVLSKDISCPICSALSPGLQSFHQHLGCHIPLVEEMLTDISLSAEQIPSLEKLDISDEPANFAGLPVLAQSNENSLQLSTSSKDSQFSPGGVQYNCNLCGLIFSSENFLSLHKDIVHSSLSSYEVTCKLCHNRFKDLEDYRDHVKLLHTDRRYICDRCPKSFKMKGGLLVHNRMVHDQDSLCKCLICKKQFTSKARKDLHERKYHCSNTETKKTSQKSNKKANSLGDAKSCLENLMHKTGTSPPYHERQQSSSSSTDCTKPKSTKDTKISLESFMQTSPLSDSGSCGLSSCDTNSTLTIINADDNKNESTDHIQNIELPSTSTDNFISDASYSNIKDKITNPEDVKKGLEILIQRITSPLSLECNDSTVCLNKNNETVLLPVTSEISQGKETPINVSYGDITITPFHLLAPENVEKAGSPSSFTKTKGKVKNASPSKSNTTIFNVQNQPGGETLLKIRSTEPQTTGKRNDKASLQNMKFEEAQTRNDKGLAETSEVLPSVSNMEDDKSIKTGFLNDYSPLTFPLLATQHLLKVENSVDRKVLFPPVGSVNIVNSLANFYSSTLPIQYPLQESSHQQTFLKPLEYTNFQNNYPSSVDFKPNVSIDSVSVSNLPSKTMQGYHGSKQHEKFETQFQRNISLSPSSSDNMKGKEGTACGKTLKDITTESESAELAKVTFSLVNSNVNKNECTATLGDQETSSKKELNNASPKSGDLKQWECDICRKSFTTKYFLKKHKRLHTGETPYSCKECGKSFTFQQSYHKHVFYHSDDKPHVCSHCGRAFKEMSTLNNHVRIHTGEKPFVCTACGKSFRQRVSYLVHQRIHTGQMPYQCEICKKSYRYKVSLRSHKCEGASFTASQLASPGLMENMNSFPTLSVVEALKSYITGLSGSQAAQTQEESSFTCQDKSENTFRTTNAAVNKFSPYLHLYDTSGFANQSTSNLSCSEASTSSLPKSSELVKSITNNPLMIPSVIDSQQDSRRNVVPITLSYNAIASTANSSKESKSAVDDQLTILPLDDGKKTTDTRNYSNSLPVVQFSHQNCLPSLLTEPNCKNTAQNLLSISHNLGDFSLASVNTDNTQASDTSPLEASSQLQKLTYLETTDIVLSSFNDFSSGVSNSPSSGETLSKTSSYTETVKGTGSNTPPSESLLHSESAITHGNPLNSDFDGDTFLKSLFD